MFYVRSPIIREQFNGFGWSDLYSIKVEIEVIIIIFCYDDTYTVVQKI